MPKAPIRDIILVLLLFVAVPATIIYLLRLPNGLIATLIYIQLLIILIQVDLSMRQQFLYRSQFTPILTLKTFSSEVTVPGEDSKATRTITITVRNLSDNPAFKVMLTRVLSDSFEHLEPRIWVPKLHCDIIDALGPKEDEPLCSTTLAELVQLLKTGGAFEIGYTDKYGTWYFAQFTIDINEKTGDIKIMPSPIPELSRLEDVGILLSLIHI